MPRRGRDEHTIGVMLVDDHRLLVETLAGAMKDQDDLEVVGTASTATEALRAALDAAPDVVLLDLRLDNQDTVDLIPRLVSVPSRPKVVVLSAARDRRHAARALEAGAVGYLTKQQPLQELFAGIRAVVRNQPAIDPALLGGVLDQLVRPDPTTLTGRELEVLRRLHEGQDPGRISSELRMAPNTLRNHVQRILTKLGASSRIEALAIARRKGLVGEL